MMEAGREVRIFQKFRQVLVTRSKIVGVLIVLGQVILALF